MKKMLLTTMLVASSTVYAADPATVPAAATNPSTPASQTTTSTAPTPEPTPAPTAMPMDCHFRIPANTTVNTDIVKTWAEKAIVQAFDYNSDNLNIKLQELKPCFTDAGWQGYNAALEQSGNLNSIKTQKLSVSSQLNGQASVTVVKENQWKVTLPLQVIYQNKQDKLTQDLSIDMMVSRKISGDLGIQQIVASQRK